MPAHTIDYVVISDVVGSQWSNRVQHHLSSFIIKIQEHPWAALFTMFSFIVSSTRQGGEAAFGVDFMMREPCSVVISIWEGSRACNSYGLQTWAFSGKCSSAKKKNTNTTTLIETVSKLVMFWDHDTANLSEIIQSRANKTGEGTGAQVLWGASEGTGGV